MNDNQRQKRVEKAQYRVLFNVPFFAPAVARLPVEFDSSVPTACTDGELIRWNPDWFDKLPDSVLPTVLCHEAAHCLLGHLWRAPGGCDWQVWNQATDHAVNLMLKEFSEIVMANRLADPFPFPDPKDSYLADPQFKGMAEEQIYGLLNARQRDPAGGKSGNKPGGSGSGGKSGQPKPGAGQPGAHSMPSFGQMAQPKPGQTAGNKKLANGWDQAMAQCAQMAKGRGVLPGSVTVYIGELFSPKVPWWELVRNWLREQANDDWNWMKPNPYYDETGFILPSLESERVGQIVFGKDTSGSVAMYQEICTKFVTEQQNCLDDLRPSKLIDICCDTRITRIDEYRPGDSIKKDFPGGGGTDFRPVFEHCERMDIPPKCLVYLTDLDGTFPEVAPPFPTLWVNYGDESAKAPFGEVINAQ